MFQIRRLLQRSTSKNCFSSAQIHTLEHLKDRTLLSLTGVEVPEFLQGLITNDINHLQNGAGSMFTMFLNTKGRVLFDSIVYRVADNTYFVECDSSIVGKMQKHLKMYQLRRKIKMNNMSDQFQVYALFDGEIVKNIKGICSGDDKKRDKVKLGDANETTSNKMLVFNDPRLNHLGKRLLIEPGTNVDQINSLGPYEVSKSPKYKFLRYNLGVGEGTLDFPIGDCLPLENNLDYLHGVSFHKGCYIGQELTARTYHTGVIRKRLMPLYFESPLKTIPDDLNIVNNDVKLGKLRGVDGNVGLAILRIVQALELGSIKVGGKNADVLRPFWWPVELPKVKASARTL